MSPGSALRPAVSPAAIRRQPGLGPHSATGRAQTGTGRNPCRPHVRLARRHAPPPNGHNPRGPPPLLRGRRSAGRHCVTTFPAAPPRKSAQTPPPLARRQASVDVGCGCVAKRLQNERIRSTRQGLSCFGFVFLACRTATARQGTASHRQCGGLPPRQASRRLPGP